MNGRRHYGKWVLAGLGAGFLALVLSWFFWPLPDLSQWQAGPPPHLWASAYRQKEVWKRHGVARELRFFYRPLEEISPHVVVAILVGEDINFFHHKGVDPSAWLENFHQWFAGHRLRGASTLTQQLAKNLFLSPERSLKRKLAELRLAWFLERKLSKRRILELYLNVAEFGPGLYGVEAAAQAYFRCSARELDPEQAASLAASIPAPSQDNPKTGSARFVARRTVIKRRAAKAQWLYQLVQKVQTSRASCHFLAPAIPFTHGEPTGTAVFSAS